MNGRRKGRRPGNAAGVAALCAALALGMPAPSAALELTAVDSDGSREVLAQLPDTVFAPRVSPDGGRVVYETIDESGEAITARLWVADLAAPEAAQPLPVVGGPINWAGIWTADGAHLVFVASGDGADALHRRRADGIGQPQHLADGRAAEVQLPGSSRLTYLTLTGDGDYGIGLLDMDTGETAPLVNVPGSAQHSSHVSPDGRWIAYASDETGRSEVWVEPLPPTGERQRVTRLGGSHPLWASNGRTLYFNREGRLHRVVLEIDEDLSAVDEAALPVTGFVQGALRRQFDLMPDGRFLMLFEVD